MRRLGRLLASQSASPKTAEQGHRPNKESKATHFDKKGPRSCLERQTKEHGAKRCSTLLQGALGSGARAGKEALMELGSHMAATPMRPSAQLHAKGFAMHVRQRQSCARCKHGLGSHMAAMPWALGAQLGAGGLAMPACHLQYCDTHCGQWLLPKRCPRRCLLPSTAAPLRTRRIAAGGGADICHTGALEAGSTQQP